MEITPQQIAGMSDSEIDKFISEMRTLDYDATLKLFENLSCMIGAAKVQLGYRPR